MSSFIEEFHKSVEEVGKLARSCNKLTMSKFRVRLPLTEPLEVIVEAMDEDFASDEGIPILVDQIIATVEIEEVDEEEDSELV